MDIILHIETTFDSVFLINGKFFEKAAIRADKSEIIYVTVLPLDATLIPYTIKLLGHVPMNNNSLCLSYHLREEHYFVRLLERYNYIYSTKKQQEPTVVNNIYKVFKLIKEKNYQDARALLTESLSSSIDNDSLDMFFGDFTDIVENKGYIAAKSNSYFLIDKNNHGTIFIFETKGRLIDNIYEYEN